MLEDRMPTPGERATQIQNALDARAREHGAGDFVRAVNRGTRLHTDTIVQAIGSGERAATDGGAK